MWINCHLDLLSIIFPQWTSKFKSCQKSNIRDVNLIIFNALNFIFTFLGNLFVKYPALDFMGIVAKQYVVNWGLKSDFSAWMVLSLTNREKCMDNY
jgi:hypothetical protein